MISRGDPLTWDGAPKRALTKSAPKANRPRRHAAILDRYSMTIINANIAIQAGIPVRDFDPNSLERLLNRS